ncbi:MAG: OmpH family outer membrane protein [Phycisphaerales bacterium]|nr:OmpH family outer membrane protein [Phycisphaerales bacterium]
MTGMRLTRQLPTMILCILAGVAGAIATHLLSGERAVAKEVLRVDLGPADALLLSGKDGPMTIRNEAGRIAWGDAAASRAYAIGCIHIDRIMKGLLASERYAFERQKFDEEARGQGEEFEKRSKELQDKFPDPKPGDPNFDEARTGFLALQVEYEKWMAQIQRIQSKHMAEQVEKAYRDLVAATEVVAARGGVDLVYRFMPADRDFGSQELADAMVQVQARPFLKYPSGIDLTDEVMKELALPRE